MTHFPKDAHPKGFKRLFKGFSQSLFDHFMFINPTLTFMDSLVIYLKSYVSFILNPFILVPTMISLNHKMIYGYDLKSSFIIAKNVYVYGV